MTPGFPLVMVQWVDAQTHDGWQSIAELVASPSALVLTVGFLIEENDDSLFLANSVADGQANAVMQIPAGWVRNRVILSQ